MLIGGLAQGAPLRVVFVFPVAPALLFVGVPAELALEAGLALEDVVAVLPETPPEPDRVELELAQGVVLAASVVAGIGVLCLALLPGMVELGLLTLDGDGEDVVVDCAELVLMVPVVVPGVAEGVADGVPVVPVVDCRVTEPLGVAVPVVWALALEEDGRAVAPPV